jgi:spore photoproduct lyase|tara:strand:+ start:7887 stop:9167 length:1281 start_codon:yes stop_codon:yes gene_type:complete
MNIVKTNNTKLIQLKKDNVFLNLNELSKQDIVEISNKYPFSFQDLRQLSIIATDLYMWNESGVRTCIEEFESLQKKGLSKKEVISHVKNHWEALRSAKIKYEPVDKNEVERPKPRKVELSEQENEVFGMCPVASEKTVCCNLMTIDAVQGCSLGCSYCSIQTFYSDGKVSVDKNLAEKLANIPLDPSKNYHIGSGQSSDSLVIGNREGVLDAQLKFARANPNIILEFKTKSNNISHLLKTDLPNNVFVCWSLNPQLFIDHEEHGTASLNQRLQAAKDLSNKGVLVGFHFHPIVYYEGYEDDYKNIVNKVMTMFEPSEIAMISMGTLTFIKPAINKLRSTGLKSKVLQIPMADAVGKSSYTKEIKKEIFSTVYDEFQPWHKDVFLYLCMEESSIWESVFGSYYKQNIDFETALFDSVSSKMNKLEIV